MITCSSKFFSKKLFNKIIITGFLCTSITSYAAQIYDLKTLFITTNTSSTSSELNRCSIDSSDNLTCQGLGKETSLINTAAYGNNYMYTGLGSGNLRYCRKDKQDRDNCDNFYNFSQPITKILQTPINNINQTDQLYVGLNTGKMWKCDPYAQDKSKACGTTPFNTFDASKINDMIYANIKKDEDNFEGKIYVGLDNGKMWRCDPLNPNGCGSRYFNVMHAGINSLAFGNFKNNQIIYAGLNNGELRVCNANAQDGCGTAGSYFTYEAPITSLAFVNRVNQQDKEVTNRLYVGLSSGALYECTPGNDGSIKNKCTLISTLNQSLTSIKYLAYPTLDNKNVIYKIYAGSSKGKMLDCTLSDSPSTCRALDLFGGKAISSITSGASFLPDLLPGRGEGEIPFRNIPQFSTFNPSLTILKQNKIYRNNSGCLDDSCSKFNQMSIPYTSTNQLMDQVKNDCQIEQFTETLYVLTVNSELKIVDACSYNKSQPGQTDTSRWVQMFRGYDSLNHKYKYGSLKVDDPYGKKGVPLKVVHAAIDGLISNNWFIKSQVYGAGTITLKDGKLISFDNCSGHFRPSVTNLYYTWQFFINNGLINATTNYVFKPTTDYSGNCQMVKVNP